MTTTNGIKVGDVVTLKKSFNTGYDDGGFPIPTHRATVTEIVGKNMVSVHPHGYHNRFVDFGASEIEKVVREVSTK